MSRITIENGYDIMFGRFHMATINADLPDPLVEAFCEELGLLIDDSDTTDTVRRIRGLLRTVIHGEMREA
jgi:hypothetical protein